MQTKTIGVSPKLYAAIAAALIAHVLADPVLELPAWADYVLQAVLTGLGVFLAPPGQTATAYDAEAIGDATKPAAKSRPKRKPNAAGYGLIELVIAVLVILVLVFVLLDVAK